MSICHGLAQDSIRSWVLSPKELKEDWDSLKTLLHDTHTSPYAFSTNADFQKELARIEASLDHEMRVADFFQLINPLFLSLKDVHSRIWIPRSNNEYLLKGGYHLPIRIRYLNERLYITADKDSLIPKGSELLAIDNIPVSSIFKRLLQSQYTDGNINNTRIRLLEESFFSQLPLYFPQDSLIPLHIRLPGTQKDSLFQYPGIKRITRKPPPKRKKPKGRDYFALEIQEDKQMAIIRIHSFSGGTEPGYIWFLRRAFKKINKAGVRALIIDLRGNKGGYINRGPALLSYLASEPFPFATSSIVKASPLLKKSIKRRLKFPAWVITFSRPFVGKELIAGWRNPVGKTDTIHWKLSMPKREKRRFQGEVYLMTDGLSISNSSLVRSAFSYADLGTVVGTPCGGTANGTFGNSVSFRLPHSRLVGRLSTIRINSPSQIEGFYPEALAPDHLVQDNINDIIDGKDTQLEFTLRLIQATPPAAPNPTIIGNPD